MRQNTKNKLGNSICVITPTVPLYLSSKKFAFSFDKIDNEPKIIFREKQVIRVKVNEINEE